MRQLVNTGPTSAAILRGEADYSEWSDEELVAGRRKSRRGTWEGRAPTVAPMELVRELARRQTSKGMGALWAKVEKACEYIAAVAAGEEEGDDVRLRHCVVLLNRVWGQAPQHIQLDLDQRQERAPMRTVVIRTRPDAIEAESRSEDDE